MPKPRPQPDLVCNYNRYNSTTTEGHILFTTGTFEPSSTANMKQIFIMDNGNVNVGYWTRWRLHVVVPGDCGCQNCILWTNFYFLHNLAPPCGARGRGGGLWGWSCPCHNQIDRWCHWFVRVWTHRVQGAGCSCCHMQAGKHKPGNRHLSWVCVCLNFTTTQQDCYKTHDNRFSIFLLFFIMFGEWWQHQPGIGM